MFERYRIIHFVGIGGIGMSGIAEVLHNLGYTVTGSDMKDSENTRRLKRLGISVSIGHGTENIDNAHVVVISSAVRDDNPEVLAAVEKSIPVIPRAEMLAEIERLKYSVLVAGSHGKTTTTSMIAAILSYSGLDPTVVIGGRLKATGLNARLGHGDLFIAEADESDGSFLKLSPIIAVATNVDREHMDYFKSMDALAGAFKTFLDKVPFHGLSILCIEDPILRSIMSELNRKCATYGFSEEADMRAYQIDSAGLEMSFRISHTGEELGEFRMALIGEHNILNALGAVSVARELRVDTEKIREALASFSGIQRRFEFKGEYKGARIYDDYGHHPTEIKAIISAVRKAVDGRLLVLFQPHRFSRTRDLFTDFIESFDGTDLLYLMDIYPAGEAPLEGINSGQLYTELKERVNDIRYIRERDEMINDIKGEIREGDLLLTLGAGDVWKVGEEIPGD